MKQLKRGILISIEGIDGSGKSTLANKLRDALQKKDFPVVLTCEPGGTEVGKLIRPMLQHKLPSMCDQTEFLLYAADRAQHFEELIIPKIQEKKLIISDRMNDSSVAYNGYGRGLDLQMIKSVNAWVMKQHKPDITLYIQLPIAEAVARLKKRKGRPTSIEQEKEAFTKRVVQGFETVFKNRPEVITLDGRQDADMLAKTAFANIVRFFKDNKLTS